MNYETMGAFNLPEHPYEKVTQDIEKSRKRRRRREDVYITTDWLNSLPARIAVDIARNPELKKIRAEIKKLETKQAESGLTENESIRLDMLRGKIQTGIQSIINRKTLPKTKTGDIPKRIYVVEKQFPRNGTTSTNGKQDMGYILSEIGRLQRKEQAVGLTASEREYLEMLYNIAGITPGMTTEPGAPGAPGDGIPGGGIPGGEGGIPGYPDTTDDIPLEQKGGIPPVLLAAAAGLLLYNIL